MIRIKRDELARLREQQGMRSWAALARQIGVSPESLGRVINLRDGSSVRTGTWGKLCQALSTPERPVRLEDLVEWVSDE
jgi:DNA-binding Xre family transcriptional regulator